MSDIEQSSSEIPSSQSSETSERVVTRALYQRKVMVTYTRAESELLRKILMRLSTDPQALEQAGIAATTTATRRVKSMWRKTDKRIERRDLAMRIKHELKPLITPTDRDVPLEGL